MNIYDLTINQLKRAVVIKEQLSKLGDELRSIFDGARGATTAQKKRRMSTSAKRKIAAAQKARWAKIRRSDPAARLPTSVRQITKKKMSPAARAKLSAKLKTYWASKKKAAKK